MRDTLFALLAVGLVGLAAPVRAQTPADGFTIHVSAPHIHQGQQTRPVHHWCKVQTPEPIIVCLLFDSPDPSSALRGVEYIVAKSLTRPGVPRGTWNAFFHDHEIEINQGHVTVHDMSPEETQKVVELVKTTDGIIFSLWPADDTFPTGQVAMDQAVGHKPLSAEEYAATARPASTSGP
jgi:hypothetical protein